MDRYVPLQQGNAHGSCQPEDDNKSAINLLLRVQCRNDVTRRAICERQALPSGKRSL